jgi:GxxExxY protein
MNHQDTKAPRSIIFSPLPDSVDIIGKQIVHAAFCVHRELGPGLLESLYETCFCHELSKAKLSFQRQLPITVKYDGIVLDAGFRIDVMVADSIICELKAVNEMLPVFEAQLLTYMKIAEKRLGFLINFNVPVIKLGIRRFVL